MSVPGVIAVTMPVAEPTAASPLLADHIPLVQGLVNAIVRPTHTLVGPLMGHGVHGVITTLSAMILVQPVMGSVAIIL